MKITLSPRARIALYLLNVLGTPLVVYARAKGWIGDLEMALWGAEVAAAMAVAGLNVNAAQPNVTLSLTASQTGDLQRGRQIQLDLDEHRRRGGRGGAL